MSLAKIVKLLNLTRSDNDHEALAAIRTANSILPKPWEQLFATPSMRESIFNAAYQAGYNAAVKKMKEAEAEVEASKKEERFVVDFHTLVANWGNPTETPELEEALTKLIRAQNTYGSLTLKQKQWLWSVVKKAGGKANCVNTNAKKV